MRPAGCCPGRAPAAGPAGAGAGGVFASNEGWSWCGSMASQGQHGFGVAGGAGGHVAEHQVAGAVAAEGTLDGVADDGAGVEYVGGLVAGPAVQVEVHGVAVSARVATVNRTRVRAGKRVPGG